MGEQKTGRDLLIEARKATEGLEADQVKKILDSGDEVTLVDVREADEWRAGHLPGAIHLPRGFLELQVDQKLPDKDAAVILYCGGGNRSALAAFTLEELGYTNIRHLGSGFTGWRDAGFEVVKPIKWTESQRDRYSRHFVLPEVGEEGQARIMRGRILVVGAGGLGSPALLYLSAAGVGTLGIVDNDAVEENNLQRQVIHSTATIGTNKAASAATTIEELNPDVTVKKWEQRLTAENVDEILAGFDVIIDATDNFATRYLLNDAAVRHGKAYVYGSIFRFEGYASVFWPAREGPCYRCMHPEEPPAHLAPT